MWCTIRVRPRGLSSSHGNALEVASLRGRSSERSLTTARCKARAAGLVRLMGLYLLAKWLHMRLFSGSSAMKEAGRKLFLAEKSANAMKRRARLHLNCFQHGEGSMQSQEASQVLPPCFDRREEQRPRDRRLESLHRLGFGHIRLAMRRIVHFRVGIKPSIDRNKGLSLDLTHDYLLHSITFYC